jgi:hypothetical protein
MSEDLQFAALHSDDALLDALGGRVPGAALGVAAGVAPQLEGDLVARLLGAYVAEIDTRRGPLSTVLETALVDAAAERTGRALVTAGAAGTSWAAYEAAPPVVPLRRRRTLAPKAVAIATTGALVLGLGGVAAATGSSPLEPLRRAVGSVSGEVTPARTPAERANQYLDLAEKALNQGNLTLAADQLAKVQRLLPAITDPDILRAVRAELDALRERWQRVIAPAAAAMAKATNGSTPAGATRTKDVDPTVNGGFIYQTPGEAPETLVPGSGVTDPTDQLPAMREDNIDHAKKQLKDKAKEKLGHPLPDKPLPDSKDRPLPDKNLPGPVGGLRGPAGSDLAHRSGAYVLLYNLAGDNLSQPEPSAVAGSLANSAKPSGPAS